MIIGIDGNEANVNNRVGIGEYAFELLRQFSSSKLKVQSSKFVVYLKNAPLEHMPKESDNWQYRVIGPKRLWTQIALPFDLLTHVPRPDVFFTPSHYAPRFSLVPTVISVMDLAYIHFPELFNKADLYQLKNWTRYSVQNAKRVLTISNASKDDIINYYKIPESKIVVTYPGSRVTEDMNTQKSTTKGKYILFVGTLQPRKNIRRLVEAFSLLKKDKDNAALKLILVGKKGWLYEEILSSPQEFNVEKDVDFLDFVSNSELAALYRDAEFFILPSLYEGFGLPILEAMKYGCPVIASNVSSIPEVGGDAVLYVDPNDSEDIKKKMELLLKSDTLKKDLIEKGKAQVKKFSWEKTAKETLKILEEVGKET